MRPPGISDRNGDYKDERLAKFKELLVDYDVVCLQECFGSFSNRRKNLIEYAKSIGFKHSVTGPGRNVMKGKLVDSGLLILSRFKILETMEIQYTKSAYSDKYSSKGAIFIKVEIKGIPVFVFTTHLQASYRLHLTEQDLEVQVRNSQLHEFGAFIRYSTTEDDRVIVCGDFNVNSRLHQFEYERLSQQVEMKDAALELLDDHPITFYPWNYRFKGSPKPEEKECLDYVFTQNVKTESIVVHSEEYPFKWKNVSDHFGVELLFQ